MDLKYLKKLQPILNKVGKKHNIPIQEGELIIDTVFKSFAETMRDPRMPKVMLPSIGVFSPRKGRLYDSIKKSIRWHRIGATTKDYIDSKIKYLWAVRNRLIDENVYNNTWVEYSKEEAKERFKRLKENEQIQKERSKVEIFEGGAKGLKGVLRSNYYSKKRGEFREKLYARFHKKIRKQSGGE